MNNTTLAIIIIFVILWGLIIASKSKIDCKSDYFTILIFAIFFSLALSAEFTDLFCENIDFGCKNCGDGLSQKYAEHKPTSKTDPKSALKNVYELLEVSDRCVLWRKYFITTAIIVLLLFLYKQSLTSVDLLVISVMCFIVLELSGNFYRYHFHNHVTDTIKDNLNIIKKSVN